MEYRLHRSRKQHDVDMTTGSIFMHLLYFSLPLLAGNLFQQLYNTVDIWVVGNFVSDEAFSAVGTVAPIVNMLIGTFMGFASGAGVVISQYYGAKNYDKVHDTVHTSIVMTIVLTIAFTAAGILLTPTLLRFMKTPDSVFPEAMTYLTIYIGGMAGLLFYNMGSSILRAVGDSRRPFYFLVVAALLNVILDLVFVIVFGMGVEGVAYATIIAQGISAVLVMVTLIRTNSCVKLIFRDLLQPHRAILFKIIRIGIPAALQMAVTAFSNVFVQSYINNFGADCMGGWTAYHKVDQLIFMPMQSLALASTTFVGQNLGVRQVDRAKKGVRTALLMSLAVSSLVAVVVMIFAPQLVAIFNNKSEVVSYGTLFMRYLTPFLLFNCINQVLAGALRGSGNSRAPMVIMLSSFVLFRQVYLYVMANYISGQLLPIALGYPAGWVVCSILMSLYYRHTNLNASALIQSDAEEPHLQQ